jgi:hypothetical protein
MKLKRLAADSPAGDEAMLDQHCVVDVLPQRLPPPVSAAAYAGAVITAATFVIAAMTRTDKESSYGR